MIVQYVNQEIIDMNSDEFEFHPLADLFPMMESQEWEEFKKSIAANGVRLPITLYEGKILDGKLRYLAAKEVGVDCPFEAYEGDDPVGFLLSKNLYRKSHSKSERANVRQQIKAFRLAESKVKP